MAVIAATAFHPVRGTLFCVSPFRSSSSGSDFYRPTDTSKRRHCDFYIAVPFAITDFQRNPSRRNEQNFPKPAPEGLRQTLPEARIGNLQLL